MKSSVERAVLDALDTLSEMQREGVRPQEARARFRTLRARHPELELDLLAEEEVFDQSIHYDGLLRVPGEFTISLSYCPERAIPWPLRGVHRWSEGDLLRVNGSVLQVHAAIACLDFVWEEERMIERLVNMCLIHEELEREPIDLSDAELQAAMDKFRAARKLFSAEATLQWMERHGMPQEKLERYVAETAIVPKLRDRITAGRIDAYFREHQSAFDIARVARLDIPDEGHAHELASELRSGAQTFFAAAERLFEATQRDAPRNEPLFATIERRHAPPPLRAALFATTPGQLIGPIPVDKGHALLRVLAIVPAQLDGRVRAEIQEMLFNDWLGERRQAARIEWCWGDAIKASNRT